MESSTSSTRRSNVDLDETCSLENLPNKKKEILGEQIGEPPWMGESVIDNLTCKIFEMREKFDIKEINNILKFLGKQSIYEDVKLFLIKHNFLCIAKYLLEKHQFSKTIKYILHITINLCNIKEGIDEIGKSRSFIKAVLYYLNSTNEDIVRKVLLLLLLATYEIQTNSESDWIVRFKECKYFGRRIIFLLESPNYRTGVELMRLILSISEINLPEQISFLEQLFDIDKLIHALLLSYIYVIPDVLDFESSKELNFFENWLRFLTMRQMQVGIDIYITDNCFNVASNMADYEKLHAFPVKKNSIFLQYTHRSLKVLCCIMKMLLRFTYIPKIYGRTMDYLNGILLMIYVILDQGDLQLGKQMHLLFEELKKLLRQYWLHIVTRCTCKHIGYIWKSLISSDTIEDNDVLEYLINCILLDYNNKIPELNRKMKDIKIAYNKIH